MSEAALRLDRAQKHYRNTGQYEPIDGPDDVNKRGESFVRMQEDYDRQLDVVAEHDWHFIDFWYFSISTISTLGFGDIVPNSRVVRGLVISEVVVGLVLLVVVLNLVLSRTEKGQTKAMQLTGKAGG